MSGLVYWNYIFTIFLIIVTIFVVYVIESKKQMLLKRNIRTTNNLFRFITKVKFHEFPDDINIKNSVDCNADSLHECLLSDPTTLFGCKELGVRCVHFDKSRPYVDKFGKRMEIPKNQDPNIGYALAIDRIAEDCNFHHGDLTLMAKNETSRDYLMVCRCKKEGYIGNNDLMGNCTTVRICGGKVKKVDVPFEELECDCKAYERMDRYNKSIPLCRELTILEANNMVKETNGTTWSNLLQWSPDQELLSINEFNTTVQDSLKLDFLLNPCVHSIIDPREKIIGSSYDAFKKTCLFYEHGIPVRTGLLKKSDQQMKLSNRNWNQDRNCLDLIDGCVFSTKWDLVYLSDHVNGQRQIAAITTRAKDITGDDSIIRISLGSNTSFGENGHLMMSIKHNLVSGYGVYYRLSTYACYLGKLPSSLIYFSQGIPRNRKFSCQYPWNTGMWDRAYSYFDNVEDKGYGLEMKPNILNQFGERVKYYGVQFVNQSNNSENNGIVSINDFNTWKNYVAQLHNV